MKIVSWNVNGIRSTWNHGLSSFLDEHCIIEAHDKHHESTKNSKLTFRGPADIYAFQETRCNEPFVPVEINGFYSYWSFCEEKRGYSGTMILSRWEPIKVSYDLTIPGSSDSTSDNRNESVIADEGRVITLEYDDFYFVNCYYPNSQRSYKRYDFRYLWDKQFTTYLIRLKARKPTIVCGDFNVAISDNDIYPENKSVENSTEGFQATEREYLLKLIESGYVDSYRVVHPEEEGVYSWWSNRRNKREENKGWRLDYALVSGDISEKIVESTMLTAIQGSDHCPVYLNIDINTDGLKKKSRRRIKKVDFGGLKDRGDMSAAEEEAYFNKIDRSNFERIWDSADWKTIEENVRHLQEALSKSAYSRSPGLIRKWQDRIFKSMDARMLAVRHVCSNNGMPGIDKVVWTTSKEKMSAAIGLVIDDYHARPSRLIIVKGKKGKTRRIHIETYQDRAMQCLCAMALDPVAESWGDKKSFAFRRGRSTFDLNEYMRLSFSSPDLVPPIEYWRSGSMASGGLNPPEWAFVGDITQCYENISHDWIIENIPLPRHLLIEFLQAGYFFAGELFPMDSGVGIGLSLSPIIANMTLDGLQEYIYDELYGEDDRPVATVDEEGIHITSARRPIDYPNGSLIRYADDIVVTARTREDAEKIWEITERFVKRRGLELSKVKSQIVNIKDGFNFMSRFYQKRDGYVYVYPSDEAVDRFTADISDTILSHTGSQQTLIDKLNRKVVGWTTYHKVEDSSIAFRDADDFIKAMLLDLCETKHPKWSREKIFSTYWFRRSDGIMCYALRNDKSVRVKLCSDTMLVRHNQVKLNMNPYADAGYVNWRSDDREIHNTTGMYRAIWERQEGKCYYCGKPILYDQEKNLVDIDAGSRKKVKRFAYVHTCCMEGSIEYAADEAIPTTAVDLMEVVERLYKNEIDKNNKFLALSEYFRKCQKPSLQLKFKEIEDILGRKLGKTAETQLQFWHNTGFGKISECWFDNGYRIKRVDLKKKVVSFYLVDKGTSPIDIPETFTNSRIPEDAKYELENFFKYVEKKYGL